MKALGWKLIPLILFLLLSFFLWRGLFLDPRHLPSAQIGKPLPQFTLPQLIQSHKFFSSTQLPKQVILLNVWASWCSACVQEQVFLMQLDSDGVPIYGLNYKDTPENALNWLAQWGNPYKVVVQDRKGTTAMDLGVYGAPETFVVDKNGMIRYRHVGIMNQTTWSKEILPLINSIKQE